MMHAVFHFNNGRDDLKGTNYSGIKAKYWSCGISYEKGNISYREKWAIEFIGKLRFTQIYTNGGNSELKEEMELFLWRTEREFVGSINSLKPFAPVLFGYWDEKIMQIMKWMSLWGSVPGYGEFLKTTWVCLWEGMKERRKLPWS